MSAAQLNDKIQEIRGELKKYEDDDEDDGWINEWFLLLLLLKKDAIFWIIQGRIIKLEFWFDFNSIWIFDWFGCCVCVFRVWLRERERYILELRENSKREREKS